MSNFLNIKTRTFPGVNLLALRGSYCAQSGLLDRRRDTEKLQKVMGVTDAP